MDLLKRIGGFLGFMLFLTPCILAGMYTGNYSTSTFVQWVVGIGIAIVELGLLGLIGSLVEKKWEIALWSAGAVLVGALPFCYWDGLPMYVFRPYQVRIPMYLSRVITAPPQQDDGSVVPTDFSSGDVRVQGKMLPIDMQKKKVDPVFFDLSDHLRPQRPDDVGSLALLFCNQNEIGRYGAAGGSAYQWECKVKVADLKSGSQLWQKSFTGSMPPSSSNHGATQSGDKPYKEIAEFLNGLPRR